MGLHARCVIEIKIDGISFSMRNEELTDFLQSTSFFESLNNDGCGLSEVPLDVLEEFVEKHSDNEDAESLKADIAWARENKDEYVRYIVY